jgi:hypothetical protein
MKYSTLICLGPALIFRERHIAITKDGIDGLIFNTLFLLLKSETAPLNTKKKTYSLSFWNKQTTYQLNSHVQQNKSFAHVLPLIAPLL